VRHVLARLPGTIKARFTTPGDFVVRRVRDRTREVITRDQLTFQLVSLQALRLDAVNCQLRSIRHIDDCMKLVFNGGSHEKAFREQHQRLAAGDPLYPDGDGADCRQPSKALSSVQTRAQSRIERTYVLSYYCGA